VYWASFKARRNAELARRTTTIRRSGPRLVRSSGSEPEETTTANLVRRLTTYAGADVDVVAHSKGAEGPTGPTSKTKWAGTGSDLVVETQSGVVLAIQMKCEDSRGKLAHWKPAQITALNAWAAAYRALPYIGVIPFAPWFEGRLSSGCCRGILYDCGGKPPSKHNSTQPGFPRPWSGGKIGGGLFLGVSPASPMGTMATEDLGELIALECLYCPYVGLGRSRAMPARAVVPYVTGLVDQVVIANPDDATPDSGGLDDRANDFDDLPSFSIRLNGRSNDFDRPERRPRSLGPDSTR
jgi:hypothetical protein